MRLLQAPRHSRQRVSPAHYIAHPRSSEPCTQDWADLTPSRHDAQMLTARTVPADPYTAWLEQREADREREEHRLNPRDAWDDLRTQIFCASGAAKG
jgi:hypothetical protein